MNCTKIEEFNVEVPDGKLYVKKWTPETVSLEPPIIMIHESLGSVSLWKDFPSVLANTLSRCVVAYDRLGFGQSTARDALPSKEFIEEEATLYFPAVKEALSIHHYVLLGHSVGGGMAVNIASRDLDCKAIVTVSAQAFIEARTLKGVQDAKLMFQQPGQVERLEKWHGPKATWVLKAWTDVWLSAEFANWSLHPFIERVRCPVLAIHGENDEYGSSAFPQFISEKSAGQSSILLIENCGHVPHREKAPEVISAVKEFLNNVN